MPLKRCMLRSLRRSRPVLYELIALNRACAVPNRGATESIRLAQHHLEWINAVLLEVEPNLKLLDEQITSLTRYLEPRTKLKGA